MQADTDREPWLALLGQDPRPWLLTSDEPAARLIALTELMDVPADDAEAAKARRDLLADPQTTALLQRLPDWERTPVVAGHQSPSFAPNLLNLLADMGLREQDSPRITRLLDQMLAHQDADGRFQTLARWRQQPEAHWGALLCDTNAITEVLARFGRGAEPGTRAGLTRMTADAVETSQGPGWPCRPDPATGFRGPGRKADVCPQVTLEALRAFAWLPVGDRPAVVAAAAGTCLRVWRERSDRQPYMFGHGRRFKTAKWPGMWYDARAVLDTLSRYPALWSGDGALPQDRLAMAEIGACLVRYNFGADGRVIPQSAYKGFEAFSFGQKKRPSPFATAMLCVVLRRLGSLADEMGSIDVLALGSSKGGSGTPVPPRPARAWARSPDRGPT